MTLKIQLTCGLEKGMRNLAHFHQNTWKCQNCYFQGIFLSKVGNSWATNLLKNLKRNELSFQDWHKESDEFWLENSKASKIYTLMDRFWPKYIMFDLKKYRGAIFHDTSVIQNLKKNWLLVLKMTWGIWLANFHQSTWNSPNWDLDGILLSKV